MRAKIEAVVIANSHIHALDEGRKLVPENATKVMSVNAKRKGKSNCYDVEVAYENNLKDNNFSVQEFINSRNQPKRNLTMSNQNQAAETAPVTTKAIPVGFDQAMINNLPATATAPVVPDGYMANAKGHLIPADKVKPVDKLRDEEVRGMIKVAKMLREDMQRAKRRIFASFNDFVALSAQEYEVQLGGKKGNTTLISYDGKFKVQLAVSENIVFDERLQVAKQLIDECLTDWTRDSNDNIKAIINQAFQVDKEGKISTHRVLSLRSLDMNDAKWDRAMDAISDAIQVTDTKEYIRFYERDEQGAYHQISLDFSNV